MRKLPTVSELVEHGKNSFNYWLGGQDPDVLNEFPAQELIRVIDEPPSREWPKTWLDAGGKLIDGRMVALKSDPIWNKISILGIPYPPFDQFDNMEIEDVDRDEAEDLKLIRANQKLKSQTRDWETDKIYFSKIPI